MDKNRRNGEKQTGMDKNRQELTRIDRNVQKQIGMDENRHKWARIDRNG